MKTHRTDYTKVELELIDKMRSRMNVSRAIIQRRAELGLTQAELGKEAGTKQSKVSEIEGMKGNPRFDTLDRITRAMGLMLTLVPRNDVLVPQAIPRDAAVQVVPWHGIGEWTLVTRYTATRDSRLSASNG